MHCRSLTLQRSSFKCSQGNDGSAYSICHTSAVEHPLTTMEGISCNYLHDFFTVIACVPHQDVNATRAVIFVSFTYCSEV